MPQRNPETTRCTAADPGGKFCNSESLPDAPFPICVHHAAEVMRYLQSYLPKTTEDKTIAIARGVVQARARKAPAEELAERKSTVYYLRVGALIKIGRTENLAARLKAYPPDTRVLAVERGGPHLEKKRHAQFGADLSHGNEWFRPSPALMAHINELRAAKAA